MTQWLNPGNTVVITGGASGIGLAAAQYFATQGMNIVLADLDEQALVAAQNTVAESGSRVTSLVTDVTEIGQVEALRDFALSEFGAVHCLMNNAGASLRQGKPWEDLAKFRQQIDINFWGVVHGCHAFVPSMLAEGCTRRRDQYGVETRHHQTTW